MGKIGGSNELNSDNKVGDGGESGLQQHPDMELSPLLNRHQQKLLVVFSPALAL